MNISTNAKMILSMGVALCFSSVADAFITEFPSVSPTAGGFGDPHFRMWSGEPYDFHGVCDLVLLSNAKFDEDLGMDIHVRSKKMLHQFSYIDALAVRIGEDTLEVKGGKEGGFWMNGEKGADSEAVALSGKYSVEIEKKNEKSTQYTINLGGDEAIVITTWNAMVRVDIDNPTNENFGTSVGMMGSFSTGEKLGRDGVTSIEEFNDFGQEWQVLPAEPKLFHETGDVQSPTQCEIPSKFEMRRRLDEASITIEEAEVLCSHVRSDDFDLCVFDVMASSDKNMVGAY